MRERTGAALLALGLLGFLGFLGCMGCSAIVAGDPPPTLQCRVSSAGDPCRELGEGFRCSSPDPAVPGICTEGECGREVCANAVDDDCDGDVDEGEPESCNQMDDDCDSVVDESLDEDGDGFTWCRWGPTALDCDDASPTVHPRAGGAEPSERCDGIDNDCNPSTSDGSDECGGDPPRDCDPVAGACVDINCRTRPALCAADQFCDTGAEPPTCRPLVMSCLDAAFPCGATPEDPPRCDPTTGMCVTPRPDGSSCTSDAECESALCVPLAALRLETGDITAGATGLCTTTCCDDLACGAGRRCWDAGFGTRACVAEGLLAPGNGPPALRACASPGNCSEGQCRLDVDSPFRLDMRVSLSCGAPYSGTEGCDPFAFDFCSRRGWCEDNRCVLQDCTEDTECPNGLCVGGICRKTCRNSSECPEWPWAGDLNETCTYQGYFTTGERVDYVALCHYQSEGSAPGGATCSADGECRDRTCVDASGGTSGSRRCAATCCSDSACGSGEQCRPIFVRGRWETHCLPRPMFGRGAPPM